VPKVSEKAIVQLARDYDDIKRRLLEAMKARDGRVVEADGVKVQLRTNTLKTWDLKALGAKLTRAVKAKVIVSRVDARALARAVKAGDIAEDDVDAAMLSATESSPFLEVTVRS